MTETDATLLEDLKRLVDPVTLGDPVRPLLWVSKSLDKLPALGRARLKFIQLFRTERLRMP